MKKHYDYVEPIGTFGMHLSGNTTQDAEDQLGAFLTLKARGLRNEPPWESRLNFLEKEVNRMTKILVFPEVRQRAVPYGSGKSERI